ncbi:MAG TPA: serine/threonine-protein kinase [Planctomycetaceae bacterium]|nr:serine/threonine-protein kinase [Planctomycetaceae bacterium]
MNGFVFKPGDTLLDGYTAEKPLGHGGFGEVYHARSAAGKDVALKLIQRFLDVELRGVGHCLNLKHPNLVTIYDVRPDTDGRQWIVMEYVAGESLSAAIEQHPEGMPVAEALRWFEPICQAVEHLHQAGIVHRDLKPGNIFDDRGTVKVGDYGLAKFITASKRSAQTQSVGTLHYMAPEVGSGRYGREVDVYAIGVILYEMLTGTVPFRGETPAEILMKHLTTPPDLEKLPVAFRGVVARMLAKNPNDRYGSVVSALTDLKAKIADAAHAESIGEPSQYPAYEAAVVSRPGASEWLEAPFAFLKNLAAGQPDPGPAEPKPLSGSGPPLGGAPLWIAEAFQVQPIGFALSLFLTMATVLIAIAAMGQSSSDEALALWFWCVLCCCVTVGCWGYVSRDVARSRGGSISRGFRAPGRPSPSPTQPINQPWRSPQAGDSDVAQPVHMGATERWDSAMDDRPDDRVGGWPQERREAVGHELETFRRWTYALGSLLMALCLGGGAGLLAAGMAVAMFGRHGEDVAAFFGPGTGLACAGLILSARMNTVGRPMGIRVLVPLILGGGVGLSVAGFWIALFDRSARTDEAAALFGAGTGFTMAAVVAWHQRLSIGRSAIIRFLNSLFWGGGVGATVGAIATGFLDARAEDIIPFLAVGAGFLTAGLFLCRVILTHDGLVGLRVITALFMGGGVGLLSAGLTLSMTYPHEEPAAFFGTGAGFLTCGIVAWHLFTGQFASRVRPRY